MMFWLVLKLNREVIHYWNDQFRWFTLEIFSEVMKNRDNLFARNENKTGVSNITNINKIDAVVKIIVSRTKMVITEIAPCRGCLLSLT